MASGISRSETTQELDRLARTAWWTHRHPGRRGTGDGAQAVNPRRRAEKQLARDLGGIHGRRWKRVRREIKAATRRQRAASAA